MLSDPSTAAGVVCCGSSAALAASATTSSKNVVDGAKNSVPVTARLKSRSRS
jgi:hypothetical protein